MDLKSAYPFWLLNKGIIASYPSLDRDAKADVTIIGAGIGGALMAWYLRNAGLKVIIVDRRHVGMGSTSATTGLLQYEIDTPLEELHRRVGIDNANRSYLLCRDALYELKKICERFPEAEFASMPSLQYASAKKDAPALKQEYALRKKIGIDLNWLGSTEIKSRFGFSREAALLSENGAAVNAYALTHALLRYCRRKNLEVYDHTEIKTIRRASQGFTLFTTDGFRIKTRKLIIACGYESATYLPKQVNQLHTTYAVVSEPFDQKKFWYRNALIWETANPYLYIRTTGNRILVGGKDDDFSSAYLRDKALPSKAKMLEEAFSKLFPRLPFKTDFKWAGAFASTKDGLPYIGVYPGKRGIYFSLGFGGNGIVFSVIAGQTIRDLISGKANPNAPLFGFSR
ncbi:MAG TPA: FAD-dependent oxidoreductase [Puia sp.]|nr:FAD-dependent oxidoreductase [Puia sp.]